MQNDKTRMIEKIVETLFEDTKSMWFDKVNEQQYQFFRPVNADVMQKYRITWDNKLNFEVQKSVSPRWVPQLFMSSRWFKLNDYLRIRFIDVEKYLKFKQ